MQSSHRDKYFVGDAEGTNLQDTEVYVKVKSQWAGLQSCTSYL